MMGSNDKPQDELFYAFNLEDVVSQDHLLRDIDRVLDLFLPLVDHVVAIEVLRFQRRGMRIQTAIQASRLGLRLLELIESVAVLSHCTVDLAQL